MPVEILIALSCDMSGISRLPRAFAPHGIQTDVLASPDFLLSRSRAVRHQVSCAEGAEATAIALMQHLDTGRHDYDLVILGDDHLNQFIAENGCHDELMKWLPCASQPALNWSKVAFAEACRHDELPTPKTYTGTTVADAELTAMEVGFPLIFKEAAGFSGNTVFLVKSPEELRPHVQSRSPDCPWLIQEQVVGENVTVDVLFNHGRVAAWSSSIVERTCNGPYGSSTARRFVPMPELKPAVTVVGQICRAHGLCGIDFIQEADGRHKIIEINCRPTVGHSLSIIAGIDFGEALAATLRGQPSPSKHQIETPVIPMFPEDVGRCIGERDIVGLMCWMVNPSRWQLLPWSEPMIFAKNLTDLTTRVIRGIRKHITKSSGYSK